MIEDNLQIPDDWKDFVQKQEDGNYLIRFNLTKEQFVYINENFNSEEEFIQFIKDTLLKNEPRTI